MEISITIEQDVVLQLATYLEEGSNDKVITESFTNLVANLGAAIVEKYLENLKKDIKENNDLSLGITAFLDFKQFLDGDLDTSQNPTVH